MRAALGARDATLISVLAYAGLRPTEALTLRWGQVRDRTLVVNAGKTGQTRTCGCSLP
jgi:integrase